MNVGFVDADALLFEGFVHGPPVFFAHLVEFVNAAQAAVCEDERAGFEAPSAEDVVFDDGGGKSCAGCAFAGDVFGFWGDVLGAFEHL